MTSNVIAAGLNRRAPGARRLPNGHLLTPTCTLTWARIHRVAHPRPPNRDQWPRFRSMLDRATVFGGWEESSGKSRFKGIRDRAPNTDGTDGCAKPESLSETLEITLDAAD